jgi:signal transduction histidine kinase
LRLRLAVLFGGLFLLSGAVLLGIVYVLAASNVGYEIVVSHESSTGPAQDTPTTTGPTAPPPDSLPGLRPASEVRKLADRDHAAELRQLLILSGIALLIMTAVSGLLGWVVAGRVLRPLRAMTGKARQISEVNLHERLAVPGPGDELKDLGDTFDGLLGRLDTAFEAQKRFVANASHELRTPLTVQRAIIEVALADPDVDVDALRAVCGRVLATGEHQERMIEALLTLARSQRGLDRREPVDLAGVASHAVRERDGNGVRLDLSAGPAPTLGDPRLVERLVDNLVDNAIRHNEDQGWAAVWTGTRNGHPAIEVTNGGDVIPADLVDSLFQPFQRLAARTAGRDGHGLGLSIVAAIADTHDAHVTATANPDGGLTVTVSFPATPTG